MELIINEGRLFGARYYTVTPLFPAHAPTWFKPEWDEMLKWCVDTFGPSPSDGIWTPGERWYVNNSKFWFRAEKDLEWFILRWQ